MHKQLIFEQPPIESTPSYIAFSKRGTVTLEDIAQFDEALKNLKSSGEYGNIINQYFSDVTSGRQKPSSETPLNNINTLDIVAPIIDTTVMVSNSRIY